MLGRVCAAAAAVTPKSFCRSVTIDDDDKRLTDTHSPLRCAPRFTLHAIPQPPPRSSGPRERDNNKEIRETTAKWRQQQQQQQLPLNARQSEAFVLPVFVRLCGRTLLHMPARKGRRSRRRRRWLCCTITSYCKLHLHICICVHIKYMHALHVRVSVIS